MAMSKTRAAVLSFAANRWFLHDTGTVGEAWWSFVYKLFSTGVRK